MVATILIADDEPNQLELLSYNLEQAGFAVLKAPDIPSILIETAFISNRKEERNLVSKSFQQKISMSIFKGIKRYRDNSSPVAFYTKYE